MVAKESPCGGAQTGGAAQNTFFLEVEDTRALCPVGDRYAAQMISEGRIPVLSCEGPCIRGEIARQAAHRVARQAPYARACQAEAVAVPESGMAAWVHGAPQVVVLDGCYLRCQARLMRRLLAPGQLVEVDTLALHRKYSSLFAIDDVPEAERNEVAAQVAEKVLADLANPESGCNGGEPG